ncbi:MAG: CDP-diacylglycerol--glycerol-3-phosphate 3-phosphatidyltransferase [Alphaproteobacteria bacterium]|nr:CDP-diacylglycerol--glycerol-3-phosphate 3-phosphatidyltransferase [Alphaproteobacteria bacterium]
MLRSLPNYLTLSRIVIIPFVVLLYYMGFCKLSASLFAYACITDFLDGYLARHYSLQSNLGRTLDPIADKLLVGAVIIMLVNFAQINIIPATAIICREILVSGLREFLAEIRVSVPVSNLAKIKTGVQMVALFILILGEEGTGSKMVPIIGDVFIWIAAMLTIVTGYAYVRSGVKYLV